MNRLTIEEAKLFLPCSEDYYNNPAYYFTIITDEDGWDNITYYTNKKLGLYFGKEGKDWVYILSNQSMPGLLKIGYTKYDPEVRSKQISRGTGIPLEFKVEWAYKCFNGEEIERETHKFLKSKRISKSREFFRIELEEAKTTIQMIGEKYI